MQTNFEKVQAFFLVYNQPTYLSWPTQSTLDWRVKFIKEELTELEEALQKNNIVKIADALADILYVTYGFGELLSLPLDEIFGIVHHVNMTQKERRPSPRSQFDVVKSANYVGPEEEIRKCLETRLTHYTPSANSD